MDPTNEYCLSIQRLIYIITYIIVIIYIPLYQSPFITMNMGTVVIKT